MPTFANPLQPPTAIRPWDVIAPLRLWHLASLDAPTVAVAWTSAFAWAVHVRLPAWAPALLALVAWAVYIGDRMLDARAGTFPYTVTALDTKTNASANTTITVTVP